MTSIQTHTLGFPRIGARRELKTALEAFWRGELSEAALEETGRQLRARHWALQAAAGLDSPENGLKEQVIVLPTATQLRTMRRDAGFDGYEVI